MSTFHHLFQISTTKASFADAEVNCLPQVNAEYRSQLAWTTNRLHWEFLAAHVNKTFGSPHFWVGLDHHKAGAKWQDSFGKPAIDSNDALWTSTSHGTKKCTKNGKLKGGYLTSADCGEVLPFVCSSQPLIKPPDNPCPINFIPYKDRCLMIEPKRVNHTTSVEQCSNLGANLIDLENDGHVEFVKAFAVAKSEFLLSYTYYTVCHLKNLHQSRSQSRSMAGVAQTKTGWYPCPVCRQAPDFGKQLYQSYHCIRQSVQRDS